MLFVAQHVGIAMLKPIKHLHEVVEVVERIVEGICSHGKKGHVERALVMHTDTSNALPHANGKG
ncbi:hypothetical protein D3C81_1684190 [compost metagenome]